MRKTFKRSLALVLSLLMLLTVSPIGFAVVTCPGCGKTVEPVIVDGPKTATCSEYGYNVAGQYCPECGKCLTNNDGRRTDKTPHDAQNLDPVAAVIPTCAENGTIAHYQCKDCGKLFLKNGDAFEEVKEAALTLYGHTFAEPANDDFTFTEKKDKSGFTAKLQLSCTAEACPATPEALTFDAVVDNGVVTKEPGCKEPGTKRYTATVTLQVYVPGEGEEAGTVETKVFTGTHDMTLEGAEYQPEHQYVFHPATKVTCVGDGNKAYYTCENCDLIFVDQEGSDKPVPTTEDVVLHKEDDPRLKDRTIHTEGDTKVKYSFDEQGNKIRFDCMKGGKEYLVCTVCEAEYSPTDIAADSHTDVETLAVAPTCTKEGTAAYTSCSVCGAPWSEPATVPALGHKTGEKVDAVAATCEHDGHGEYWQCTRCDAIAKIDDPDFDHPYYNTTDEDGNVTATAVQNAGLYEPILAHEMGLVSSRKDPACLTSGTAKIVRCKHCSQRFMEYELRDEIPAAAFANEDGQPTYDTYKDASNYYAPISDKLDATLPALGHLWVKDMSEGAVGYLPATCSADGYVVATCPRCNATKTITLKATDHRKGDKIGETDPTCEENAMSIYVCTVCNQEFKVDDLFDENDPETAAFAATGHTLSGRVIVVKESTCTEKGYEGRPCLNPGCTYVEDQVELPLAAHNTVLVPGAAADCQKEGKKDSYKCSNCGKIFSDAAGTNEVTEADLVLAKTNHVDADGNNICDVCNEVVNGCTHICHSTNPFYQFIWFIARLWYQFLGINQYCECGLAHYDDVVAPPVNS